MTEKILLIEDDPAVARSISDALTAETYSVVWRNSGASGIAAAQDEIHTSLCWMCACQMGLVLTFAAVCVSKNTNSQS